jgi:hypothetical protein
MTCSLVGPMPILSGGDMHATGGPHALLSHAHGGDLHANGGPRAPSLSIWPFGPPGPGPGRAMQGTVGRWPVKRS